MLNPRDLCVDLNLNGHRYRELLPYHTSISSHENKKALNLFYQKYFYDNYDNYYYDNYDNYFRVTI